MRAHQRDRVHRESGQREPSRTISRLVLAGAVPLAIAGLMVAYLQAARRAAGEIGFPLDDSWIHARFAANLARGLGFSFNPGEPTSTTTAALWTLLYAGAHWVTREFLLTSFVLNGLLCWLLCIVSARLAGALGAGGWGALLVALTVAVTAPLPWWALSGMEPPLYALLATLGIALHVTTLAERRWPRQALTTLVFALAGLARPECLVLFPLAMADRMLAHWRGRRSDGGRPVVWELVGHSALFIALISPLFLYNHRATGYWLPSSFYSKEQALSLQAAAAGLVRLSPGKALVVLPLWELWDVIKLWAVDNAALLPSFAWGLGMVAWQGVRQAGQGGSLLPVLAVVLRPVTWALAAGYRPAGFQSQRYFADVNVLYLVLGVVGAVALAGRIRPHLRRWCWAGFAGLALAVSLLGHVPAARTYALNVKNITEMQVAVGRWLARHASRDSLLALNDIGAIGVITGARVLDLQGLVTPEILEARSLAHRADGSAPRRVFEFLASRRPDYVVVFPNWYPEYGQMAPLFTEVHRVEIRDNITCGGSTMIVYRADWEVLERLRGERGHESR